jgi:predicted ABC-type transport system involved in lysophospholipase L1 biosynthesis ATPase subunit
MDPVTVLEAHSLYRFFHAGDDEALALQGVSLTVAAGELVAVTGPSGSGKSTLLACLAGLDDPDGGTVVVSGERLSRQPEAARARIRARRIGVLFQHTNLVGHLSVAANVSVARRLAGKPADAGGVAGLLDRCGIAARARARAPELSGGELASRPVSSTKPPRRRSSGCCASARMPGAPCWSPRTARTWPPPPTGRSRCTTGGSRHDRTTRGVRGRCA